jgi:FimV-like protein
LYQRLKQWLLVVSMLIMPLALHAVELGKLHVISAIGQPLNAEIELIDIAEGEFDTLSAVVAGDQAYASLGLSKPGFYDQIVIQAAKNLNDLPVLVLSSPLSIEEPFLNILIQLSGSHTQIVREYALLLDHAIPAEQEVASPSVDVPQPVVQELENLNVSQDQPYYQVPKGESLVAIAQKAGYEVDINKAILALFKANPHAFNAKNINGLRQGTKLHIPSEAEVMAIDAAKAYQFVVNQNANWEIYQAKLANLTIDKAAVENEPHQQSSAGKLSSENKAAENKEIALADAGKDVVKLSKAVVGSQDQTVQDRLNALQDEIAAHESSIQESNKKTQALEKQILEMQHLLLIKNQTIKQLQQNPGASVSVGAEQANDSWITKSRAKILWLALFVVVLILAAMIYLRAKQKREYQGLYQSLEDFNRLNASLSARPAAAAADKSVANQVEPSDEAASLKTLDLIKSIDFDLSKSAPIQHEPKAIVTELNLADINLDFNPKPVEKKPVAKKSPTKKVPAKTSPRSDIDMQLDLAATYIDMGDKKRARKLLQEVVQEGLEEQKKRAQEILSRLA